MKPRSAVPFPLAAAVLVATATAQGSLLVASRNTDQVLQYDEAGAFQRVFAAGGGLDNPVGITFGPDGHLYVASANNDQVLQYDGTSGAFRAVFASGGGLSGARQLNFGPDGHLYVASGRGSQILRYHGATGAFLGVFAQDPALRGPTGFTFGPEGDLYVGGVLSNVLVRFDGATGTSRGVFASTGLDGPHDLAFGADGLLYVSNAFGADNVVRFDPRSGALVDVFVRDAALVFPLGLVVLPDGDLLLANQGGHDVRRYDGRTGQLRAVAVAARSGGLDGPLFLLRRPAAAGLRHLTPLPPAAGGASVFAVEGARPGGLSLSIAGIVPGRLPLPICAGLALGILDPVVLGVRAADEGGCLAVRLPVPAALAGQRVLLQALDLTGCATSPVHAHVF